MKKSGYAAQIVYPEDIECVLEARAGRGAIYIGNLEASQNLRTLKSIPLLNLSMASDRS